MEVVLKHFFYYNDNDDDDYDNDYSYNNNAKYAWFHIELFPLRIAVFFYSQTCLYLKLFQLSYISKGFYWT